MGKRRWPPIVCLVALFGVTLWWRPSHAFSLLATSSVRITQRRQNNNYYFTVYDYYDSAPRREYTKAISSSSSSTTSTCCMMAYKNQDKDNSRKDPKQPQQKQQKQLYDGSSSLLKKYNDLAFGFVSLGGLAATQNVDFVATFVGISSALATLANQNASVLNKVPDQLLPALSAALTAVLFPVVMILHSNGSTSSSSSSTSPIDSGGSGSASLVDLLGSNHYLEFVFCLASIGVALVDWKMSSSKDGGET
ncbi:hypothetical protein ACA910_017095 [Epithemia clementina (nom. ined.)]